jgi:hypothetical protein
VTGFLKTACGKKPPIFGVAIAAARLTAMNLIACFLSLRRLLLTNQCPIGAQREHDMWPFPPATGPVLWTSEQIKQYEQQKRDSVGEALV